MKVCVYGTGAIGGHLAARLAKGGAEVSVVARGANLAAFRQKGLTVRAPDGEMHCRPAASDNTAELGPQDAVVVTVKAPALPAVAAGIAPLLKPGTNVVFAMNGVPWWYFMGAAGPHQGRRLERLDPGGKLWDAVGEARAVGGVIWSPCTVLEPGLVHVGGPSKLDIGRPDGSTQPQDAALAEVFKAGGLPCKLFPNIRDQVWSKLLLNLSQGPLSVLAAAAPKDVLVEAANEQALRSVVAEGKALAAQLGCEATLDVDRYVANSKAMTHKPSILQDLEAGRPMEVDAIYEAVLDLAEAAGARLPVLSLVTALMKVRARAAGLYDGPAR